MKWRSPTFMDDMRSSSDIQDADFTNQRVPPPPQSFTVIASPVSGLRFTIRNRFSPRDREVISSYRVYFIPVTVGPITEIASTARRRAAYRMAKFACSVEPTGDPELLIVDSNNFDGEKGWYFAVAVNNSGTEGIPTLLATAP